MSICNTCSLNSCIKRVPIFRTLADNQLKKVASLIKRREYKAKQVIFHQGDLITCLIVLREGRVKLVRYSDSDQIILDVLRSGDFYGLDALFYESYASDDLIASEDSKLCYIDAKKMRDLINKEPDIALKMLEYYAQYSRHQNKMLEILSLKDSLRRVASFLVLYSNKIDSLTLDISQYDIASSINLRPESVNRKLSLLKKKGLISSSRYKNIKILKKNELLNL